MDVISEHREVMRYLFKALARKYTKLTIKTLVCDIKNAQTLKEKNVQHIQAIF